MTILKLLSEEVFDFSSGQMTQAKAKHLKDTMCSEFSQIFQLCQFVLDNSQNVPLVAVTLETLLRFLNWIPLGYIFETKLISTLVFKVIETSFFFFFYITSFLFFFFNIIILITLFAVLKCTDIQKCHAKMLDGNRCCHNNNVRRRICNVIY